MKPETINVVEIDQQTKDELQPPCTVKAKLSGRCSQAAEWVVTVRNKCRPTWRPRVVICSHHLADAMGGQRFACGCAVDLYDVEPLR